MNQDQILSLARTLLKMAGAAAIAHGVGDSAGWEAITGGALAIIGIVWSHFNHAPASHDQPTH